MKIVTDCAADMTAEEMMALVSPRRRCSSSFPRARSAPPTSRRRVLHAAKVYASGPAQDGATLQRHLCRDLWPARRDG